MINHRTFLPLVVIVALALAGSALAQPVPGELDQPGTATTQSGAVEPSTGDTTPETQPASPPPGDTTGGTTSQPQTTPSPAAELPSTAGSNPLMFMVGLVAIVAFATLLIYKRHGTDRS